MQMSAGKKKTGFKNSIRVQLACIFILTLVLVVVAAFVVNRLFLRDYYVQNKVDRLERSFEQIDELSEKYGSDSEELSDQCNRLVNNYNISVIVATSSFEVRYSSENRSDILISRLAWHFFSNDARMAPVPKDREEKDKNAGERREEKRMKQTDDFVIEIAEDPMMSSQYIELWGILNTGDLIFIRTPLESIIENVSIANTFLFYIMIVTAIIGIIAVWLLSKKITDPILQLTDVADRMAHLDFDARYEYRGKNEIDELGEHINELSVRLEKSMSELKTANNELKKDIEKKEEIENMRTEFISNVSHELKTPISLIQGYAEGLKDNISSDEESRNFYCDVIMDEADKMNKLVKNLLTLNRLEFGNEEIVLERFDMAELIGNCMASSDIMLKQFGVSADFKCDESIFVWGDEFRAEEVFTNLFSNAIHYCSGDKHIEVSAEKNADKVRITVFNTGDPIAEDSLEHIWEKFYKADKARSREVGGTGIGLSIVKALMESMNNAYGVINYENGVAFYFELDSADGQEGHGRTD